MSTPYHRRPLRRLAAHALVAPIAVTAIAGAALGITPILTSGTPSSPDATRNQVPTREASPTLPPPAFDLPDAPTVQVGAAIDRDLRPVDLYREDADQLPDAAAAAYQRAAIVLNSAAPECRLDWTLLAAIGRIASDHGEAGGGRLTAKGVSRPAVLGARLDGRQGRARVKDTDAGRFDDDERYDAAVGPMHLLPATWTLVAVDADGDERRNPQDIDDAALGAAVLLCGGRRDLRKDHDRREALRLFNQAPGYPALVDDVAAYYESHPGAQLIDPSDVPAPWVMPSLPSLPDPLPPGTPTPDGPLSESPRSSEDAPLSPSPNRDPLTDDPDPSPDDPSPDDPDPSTDDPDPTQPPTEDPQPPTDEPEPTPPPTDEPTPEPEPTEPEPTPPPPEPEPTPPPDPEPAPEPPEQQCLPPDETDEPTGSGTDAPTCPSGLPESESRRDR